MYARKVGCVFLVRKDKNYGDAFLLREMKVILSYSKAGYFRMRSRKMMDKLNVYRKLKTGKNKTKEFHLV